jgi:hypothetical protein
MNCHNGDHTDNYRAYLSPKQAITRHSFWKMAKSVTGISVFGLDKHWPSFPSSVLTTLNSLETFSDVYTVIKLCLRDRCQK